MSTAVRSATTKDLPLVTDHYGKADTPRDPFGDVSRLEAIPLEGLLVAEVEGEYAGFLYWFEGEKPWFDRDVGRYAHIEEVQVLRKHRGRGVGKRLLTSALNRLMASGVEAIYIDTTEGNDVARHLYEAAGFRPIFGTIHYKLSP